MVNTKQNWKTAREHLKFQIHRQLPLKLQLNFSENKNGGAVLIHGVRENENRVVGRVRDVKTINCDQNRVRQSEKTACYFFKEITSSVKISRNKNCTLRLSVCKVLQVIPKGSEYITVIYHSEKSVPISKKLYGGRQYYRHIHSNSTSTYHSECYVG